MVSLVKGFAGKPAHPPLTDIGIGAYTAGVAMLVAGAAGFQQAAMASASVIAIAVGLIAAIPTIITGLVDLFAIPADAPARTLGWWHLTLMASATGLFAWTFKLQLAGYSTGKVITLALTVGIISWVLLFAGGYLGGALTFVYGVRVLNRTQASMADALIPARADHKD
ncbi:MAG TPA: DUF2231 domain-containing protein [Pseudonocardiaceae bacterium]|nr:DUF2231 domain-containing protein [Pseudonocardiaceae bacterium]